jgi:hypothetical protein
MGFNFHNSDVLLRGIGGISKNCRTAWRQGMKEQSPYQKKTINLNRLLRSITTISGVNVFTGLCPVLLGDDVGSTLATSRNSPEVIEFRDRFAENPVQMAYWIAYEELFLDASCIAVLMTECDADDVLLITKTDYDTENRRLITPFAEPDDEFLCAAEEDGLMLDLTAMETQQPNNSQSPTDGAIPSNVPIDPQSALRANYARRLRLRDDSSFTTRNLDAVSRVTGATANTSGAMSNRTTTTIDANRTFCERCLEHGRDKAAANIAAIREARQQAPDPDNDHQSDTSQGQPASEGSAAAVSKTNSTSANLPSVSRDGGAPA